jgi:hypothetical protein
MCALLDAQGRREIPVGDRGTSQTVIGKLTAPKPDVALVCFEVGKLTLRTSAGSPAGERRSEKISEAPNAAIKKANPGKSKSSKK